MTDGKKKRTRKRQRRSAVQDDVEAGEPVVSKARQEEKDKGEGADDGEGAGEGEGSGVNDKQDATPRLATASQDEQLSLGEKQAGPTLSFYERTNPHKPSAIASLHGSVPRRYTVSIALPGSIILNAQSPELQSRLAGQLARSCAIFNVDEIIVYSDGEEGERGQANGARSGEVPMGQGGEDSGNHFDPNAFLARILQYVETPQYLRKSLFPMHRDLRMAGILAPLDCPHHLRYEEESPYREGVCVEAPHWANDSSSPWVYTGFKDPIQCIVKGRQTVPLGARVTVKMPIGGKKVGHIVSPREPVQAEGLYWGYTVRLCNSLSEAISTPSWKEPYDLVIGTSERGNSLTDVIQASSSTLAEPQSAPPLTAFCHALLVFGGLSGLEVAIERDANIQLTADEASELFDSWINVIEGQGSRTIRTEEALLIAMARLKPTLESLGQR